MDLLATSPTSKLAEATLGGSVACRFSCKVTDKTYVNGPSLGKIAIQAHFNTKTGNLAHQTKVSLPSLIAMSSKAPRISPEEWQRHKSTIRSLYAQTKLDEVVKRMEEEHGFVAR